MALNSKHHIEEEWLTVGKLVAAQGLRGEVRVNPQSDFPERFTKPGKRWLQSQNEPPAKMELLSGRQLPGKSIYIIRFKGITDRVNAESLIGKKLLVPSKHRPQMSNEEFHLLDLIGLEARLMSDGPSIGHVTNLTRAGNDLLELELIEGKKILVPFVKAIVPEVNIHEGWLLVTPPPGLLDL